jgi:hypothetical protein
VTGRRARVASGAPRVEGPSRACRRAGASGSSSSRAVTTSRTRCWTSRRPRKLPAECSVRPPSADPRAHTTGAFAPPSNARSWVTLSKISRTSVAAPSGALPRAISGMRRAISERSAGRELG